MPVNPERIAPPNLGFAARPSEQQRKDADAIAKLITERRERFDPYVGRKFVPKQKPPRYEEYTIVDFHPALPLGAAGVRPAFRVERGPLPGVWFEDAEAFLDRTVELTPPTDAPAAAT